MNLEYVPLLGVQRSLHDLPRGPSRFRAYLDVMLNDSRDAPRFPPLVMVNPMAKDHVATLLDTLLTLDADGEGARALAAATDRFGDVPGEFKASLVVIDDAGGGWTSRHAIELGQTSDGEATRKSGWLTCPIWSSEPASARSCREAVMTAVFRYAYRERNGSPRTLRERLDLEGYALAMAGCDSPSLDTDDLAYSREVIAPFLDATDMATCIECLYGDTAARSLGFTPRGLSDRAGLALALDDAKANLLARA
jgi:hypothetical protein